MEARNSPADSQCRDSALCAVEQDTRTTRLRFPASSKAFNGPKDTDPTSCQEFIAIRRPQDYLESIFFLAVFCQTSPPSDPAPEASAAPPHTPPAKCSDKDMAVATLAGPLNALCFVSRPSSCWRGLPAESGRGLKGWRPRQPKPVRCPEMHLS